jgi:putative membrane protein
LIFLYLNQWCNLKAILLILGLALFSFSVEMIGVNTGLLFGTYEYGDTLGIKWLGVPLIISLNWVLLNLSAYGVFKNTKMHFIFKALLASLLIVFLDVLIEPVAIKLDYWDWENETIPFKNYLTWFVVSFLIQWVVIRINININSFITFIILLIQFLFFGFLNFLL